MTITVNTRISSSAQRGLSLVELMVSMLLGLLLTAGIVSVYLESKRNFAAEEEMARIQENGRFALSLLKRELTLAGFYGGYFDIDDISEPAWVHDCSAGTDKWSLDPAPAVELINNYSSGKATTTGTTFTTDCLPDIVRDDTDVISLKRTAGQPSVYDANTIVGATFDPNEVYLEVKDYGDEKNWYTDNAGFDSYSVGDAIEYWEMYTRLYFIQDYSVATTDGIPTLCMMNINSKGASKRCLVEGVEDMQLVFGIDENSDNVPNYYTPDPNDMDEAVSARLYLRMRSVAEMAGSTNRSTKTYQLGMDPNETVTDNYLRRVFSTTVQMRNSVLPALN